MLMVRAAARRRLGPVERVGEVVEDVVNGFRSVRSTYAGCDRCVFDAQVTAASSASSSTATREACPLDAI